MENNDALYSFINLNVLKKNTEETKIGDNQEFITFYEKNPLFEHIILHIKSYLKQNSNSLKEKSKVECLSAFIKKNKFDNKILKQIIKNGIPNQLPCLRAMLWKSLIGYLPINDLSQWRKKTCENFQKYRSLIKEFKEFPNNITDESDEKMLIQINKDLPCARPEISFLKENQNYQKMKQIMIF